MDISVLISRKFLSRCRLTEFPFYEHDVEPDSAASSWVQILTSSRANQWRGRHKGGREGNNADHLEKHIWQDSSFRDGRIENPWQPLFVQRLHFEKAQYRSRPFRSAPPSLKNTIRTGSPCLP